MNNESKRAFIGAVNFAAIVGMAAPLEERDRLKRELADANAADAVHRVGNERLGINADDVGIYVRRREPSTIDESEKIRRLKAKRAEKMARRDARARSAGRLP